MDLIMTSKCCRLNYKSLRSPVTARGVALSAWHQEQCAWTVQNEGKKTPITP